MTFLLKKKIILDPKLLFRIIAFKIFCSNFNSKMNKMNFCYFLIKAAICGFF